MKEYLVEYIDAFTNTPFAGNPCAVLPRAEGLSDEQMQAIARETNLNETSFVLPSDKADFRVRYFTPRNEIPFAGHPTIATAFLLAQEGYITLQEPVTRITLEFKIGVLPVEIEVKKGKPQKVTMTQQKPTFGMTFDANIVAPCLGLQVEDLRSDSISQVVSTGVPFLIVPVREVSALGKVKMDRDALVELVDKAGVSAAYLFSLGGFKEGADTHARLFDPRGTSEDPFTGSAAGAMGCFIVHHGLKEGPVLFAEQGNFVNRPGDGVLEIKNISGKIESVKLSGSGVKVLEGKFFV